MQISTLADLLNEFVLAEKEMLNQQNIKHPPTIGAMYEGLTKEVLEKSIFSKLNLKVIKNSFIKGSNTEFDVMLVEGDGCNIPHTDSYTYDPENVIVVIQVKKNLHSKDIKEGYKNLQFIVDYYQNVEPKPHMIRQFRDGFRSICRKDITAKQAGELSTYEEGVYNTLKLESVLPVRILWGYNGFSNEYAFRKSFVDYLESNISKDNKNIVGGFGPHNFPNLIICDKYSMMKQNGMPGGVPLNSENWWSFYTSSAYNPTLFFLELIWTRLTYRFKELSMDVFGEDLTVEPIKPFLDCRIKESDGKLGWEYFYYDYKNESLTEHSKVADWSPIELDEKQFVIINELCKKEHIDLTNDDKLEEFIISEGTYTSLASFLEKLKATGLVYVENNKLKLLTDECQCVFLPDGRVVAADNRSGRLSRWALKEFERLKKGN